MMPSFLVGSGVGMTSGFVIFFVSVGFPISITRFLFLPQNCQRMSLSPEAVPSQTPGCMHFLVPSFKFLSSPCSDLPSRRLVLIIFTCRVWHSLRGCVQHCHSLPHSLVWTWEWALLAFGCLFLYLPANGSL